MSRGKHYFNQFYKVELDFVGDPTSIRDKDISLYTSGCKPHP